MCDCESLILMDLIAREERMHSPFISVHSGASEAEVNGGNGVRRHQKRVEDGGIFERRSVANQVFCSKTLERCERLRGEFLCDRRCEKNLCNRRCEKSFVQQKMRELAMREKRS
jgi:hypothetical protein